MSIQKISKELLTVFKNEVADIHNLPYRVENDSRPNPDADTWAMVSYAENEFVRQSFRWDAYTTYQNTGAMTVQLFSPIGVGTKAIYELAEAIRDVYNDRYVKEDNIDIRLLYPTVTVIGRVENLFQLNITIGFETLVEKPK